MRQCADAEFRTSAFTTQRNAQGDATRREMPRWLATETVRECGAPQVRTSALPHFRSYAWLCVDHRFRCSVNAGVCRHAASRHHCERNHDARQRTNSVHPSRAAHRQGATYPATPPGPRLRRPHRAARRDRDQASTTRQPVVDGPGRGGVKTGMAAKRCSAGVERETIRARGCRLRRDDPRQFRCRSRCTDSLP